MKRYIHQIVAHWIATQAVNRERKPKPFPGKSPTKLMLSVTIAGRYKFKYLGKPSRATFNEFNKVVNKPIQNENFHMYSIEFDKGGIVNLGISNLNGPKVKTNVSLWQHYHPEMGPDLLPTWLNWAYKVVNGTYRIV